ncbi:nicotinate-nicotinamide nucleotide adenylyltransferase [Thermus parvatiensis]|uniref:Probable nicotinate-nucleotide adenylyltransferase n=3 Tax=Thermus TaxID=270 RepID=H7GI40_9DEIN|nr:MULTISPECIES: nicotinate-nucleotide adenylyltransferase [Thermus]AEG34192.1 nicotinate-nucleotide adenylyltransferase [Thermus thermophilus SG0.5JP17-16]AMA75076.1 nicotinate-nicotinamide nucleotide adenylyltransferase [Thermus parvatiensis]EIA38636.1 nicotinic acid mononucleotide adenylyltransferase [Thermus parvatiensis]VCU54313.1 Probable nicotinate-nucleotide adenylyltransferase [Thermus thermophilus]
MRIGLFGGSFDPIHLGHLLAASQAQEVLGLDRVLFVVAARPPHKVPVAPAEARYEMTLLAVAEDPRFTVSRLELDRPGPSYTVDTLREARRLFPEDELFFITGADAYRDVLAWKEGERLPEYATLVAVARPGYPLKEAPLPVVPLFVPEVGISSTEIRRRLKEGRSVRYWVPRAVEVYIEKHGLYR